MTIIYKLLTGGQKNWLMCNNGRILCPELNISIKFNFLNHYGDSNILVRIQVGWILIKAYKGLYTMVKGFGTYYPVSKLQYFFSIVRQLGIGVPYEFVMWPHLWCHKSIYQQIFYQFGNFKALELKATASTTLSIMVYTL